MNHPHKKKEPFPGQGERWTEIPLQAKLRRRSDVMLVTFTNTTAWTATLVHLLRPKLTKCILLTIYQEVSIYQSSI